MKYLLLDFKVTGHEICFKKVIPYVFVYPSIYRPMIILVLDLVQAF